MLGANQSKPSLEVQSMPKFVNALFAALVGTIGGASILVICIAASVGLAWMSKDTVTIPGVFTSWFTVENDLPALNFEPNGIGMVGVILAIATLSVLSSLLRSRKTSHKELA